MATRTAAPGLSTDELARIRDTLAAGRKPKVVFTAAAGQIAGQVGQVVELTDPELSDEWVVVRFGRDELPFSPTDLQLPAKATRPSARTAPVVEPVKQHVTQPVTSSVDRSVGQSVPESASESAVGSAPATASVPGPREEPSVPTSTTVNGAGRPVKGAKAAPAPIGSAADGADGMDSKASDRSAPAVKPDAGTATSATGVSSASAVAPAPGATATPAKPAARKAAKPKPPPSLTVTLTYAEGEWMVGATQGAKALAKPYVIKPAEALKMVSMLDVPGVHEAVDEIVSAARAEAEQQAEKLRAELAEIESRLAELREAG
jgi:hypothetical protein